jgi:Transposase DDE domain
MDETLILIYCLCADCLKALGVEEHPRSKMSNAEVLTTAVTAAYLFCGCHWKARWYLSRHGYITRPLSESRLNRRLHAFDPDQLYAIVSLIGQIFSAENGDQAFLVDSFPLPVCDNVRIFRCQIFTGEEFRGYCASKKRYFYGIKVHLITTVGGKPVQFACTPGSCNDLKALKHMQLNLPRGALLYADAAYTDYGYEEELLVGDGVQLIPQRRSNLKRQWPGHVRYLQSKHRKRIETAISSIKHKMPRRIAANTAKGFMLKVFFFILCYSIEQLTIP